VARESFTDVAGLRVRRLEEGDGAAVLFLHGASLGSSADVWTANLGDFAARGLRAIAVDLPGFGRTDNPSDHSVGFRTAFVPLLLDALGLERAHVVGHSQSGRIAVGLALKQSARIAKIVVVGTASMLPPLENAAKGDDAEGDEGGATEPTPEDIRRMLEANVFDRTLVTPDAVALRHRMSTGKNFQAFLARQAAKREKRGGEVKPLWERLAEVTAPMRLIYGRQDRAAERRAALARERYPALDIHLVDRCGHLVQWDARSRFAELAGDFLAA
jgi:pimeloyl-ACP methyl ester carboxylesterase